MISALVVMGVAMFSYNRFIEKDSEQIMKLICSEKKQQIDEKLLNIEQSVNTIYHFAVEQINDSEDLWQDDLKFDEHIKRMTEVLETTVKYTDGAVTAYYRLNPELRGSRQGIWLVREADGTFKENPVTDISEFSKDDVEHVGWYYTPVEKGEAVWMNPYYNQNLDLEMISYVIPVFHDGKVIGVVGMDITTELLYDNTKSVVVYDTGYAFLLDEEGKFLYHPEMKNSNISDHFNREHAYLYEKSLLAEQNRTVETYTWNHQNKRMAVEKLSNGMLFTVCVSEEEIQQPRRRMFSNTVILITLVILVFMLVTIQVTKVMLRLTYTDILTGLGNRTAYREAVDSLNKRIRNKETVRFAVVVVDINNLKEMNDSYGHVYGDELIQGAADIVKRVWGSKASFRIGGDEFVVILQNTDEKKLQKDLKALEAEMQRSKRMSALPDERIEMAVGTDFYHAKTDESYEDVFRRADEAMYEDKKRKKEK